MKNNQTRDNQNRDNQNRGNQIGLYQTGIFSFFFTRCFFMTGIIPLLFKISGIDSLISIILGSVLGLLLVFLYYHIIKKEKNKNIFELIDSIFPKVFAVLFKIILTITLLFILCFLLSNISVYISNSLLIDTRLIVIVLTFLLLCYFVSKNGLESIARTAEIIFMIFIILFVLSLVGVIPLIEPSRLKPFFSHKLIKIGNSSFIYGFFGSIMLFLLTMIPKEKVHSNKKLGKAITIGYIIGTFTIFLTFVWMIGTLGIDLASYYQYPEIAILKKVSYFNFIERIEGILSIAWLLDSVIVLSFILYSLKEALHTFSKSKKTNNLYILLLISITILSSRIIFSLEQLLIPLSVSFILLPIIILLQIIFTKQKKT